MDECRLIGEADVPQMATIVANAYPGGTMARSELEQRLRERLDDPELPRDYGLFRDGRLLGSMRLHDFTMRMLSRAVPAGGLGGVAVAFDHKREHVAKSLVEAYLAHYRGRGTAMAVLYAFRTDFYYRMGFGFGPKMYRYRLPPARFPRGESKRGVRLATAADAEGLAACYARRFLRTHGLLQRSVKDFTRWFQGERFRVALHEAEGEVRGYLLFSFRPGQADNFVSNDMHIEEFVYETPAALGELMTFLHSQADQIRFVFVHTPDPDFHHLIADARNGTDALIPSVYHETNTAGVGLMYRVIDTGRLFTQLAGHDFGGQTCDVRFVLADDFLPDNDGALVVGFRDGHAQVRPTDAPVDVEVRMPVAEFSALLVGTVGFRRLLQYGRAAISDTRRAATIHALFRVDEGPVCLTPF